MNVFRPMCCNWNTLIEFDECVSTNVLQPIKTVARMCFQCLEVLQGVSINNFDKCVSTNASQLHTFIEFFLKHLATPPNNIRGALPP